MSRKTVFYAGSALAFAGWLATIDAASAGGMSHIGAYGGMAGMSTTVPNHPNCRDGVPMTRGGNFHQSTVENNINVYKPTTINNNINVYKPITIDRNVSVYKPVTINKSIDITNNIDNSKNIEINKPISIVNEINVTKNIDNSKYIDASKNININKSIVINNGAGDAAAIAIAEASAAASATASVSIYGNSNASSASNSTSLSGSVFFGGGVGPEAPAQYAGGDIGNISVDITPAAKQCVFRDATVVKSVHAVCISADNHEFPASHMTGDAWISSSYDGELARCLPGSKLKVTVGQLTQSNEGVAAVYNGGQVLQCGSHEALRYYKDGMLKCAPAVAVPDCTERTNLRKFGTGDMFFSYRAKICAETGDTYANAH